MLAVKQKRWVLSNNYTKNSFFLPLILNPKSISIYFHANMSVPCNAFIMEVVPHIGMQTGEGVMSVL